MEVYNRMTRTYGIELLLNLTVITNCWDGNLQMKSKQNKIIFIPFLTSLYEIFYPYLFNDSELNFMLLDTSGG